LEWFCGIGVGNGLMKYTEAHLHKLGYNRLWLWVYVLNARAIAFYEKQGYLRIGNAFFKMEQNSYENKVLVKSI
jgi:ribosomal protein S18 acetylase RimI-like enzyme